MLKILSLLLRLIGLASWAEKLWTSRSDAAVADAENKNLKEAARVIEKQRDIANQPDASVDAVADWLSGGPGSDR